MRKFGKQVNEEMNAIERDEYGRRTQIAFTENSPPD